MPPRVDITGQQFGRLRVIRFDRILNGCTAWLCRCECGNELIVRLSGLQTNTRSCGCLQCETIQRIGRANRTHGEAIDLTAEYRTWHGMKQRCLNPRAKKFDLYGGRGISVCQRWLDGFENFLTDMGRKPSPAHSLDRINGNGDYTPKNCRWATPSEQNNNRRGFARKKKGKN